MLTYNDPQKYQITRKESWGQICGICGCCGGPLAPIETEDNAGRPTFWVSCPDCQKFTQGVKPMHYDVALRLQENHETVYNFPLSGDRSPYEYPWDQEEDPALKEHYRRSDMFALCDRVALTARLLDEVRGS